MTLDQDAIHDEVRARYGEAARAATARRSDSAARQLLRPDGTAVYGDHLYADADRAALPDAALLASLGCGNPTAVAELREGERVLDLGSGGGIDVILSARRVGPTGRAFGLDMTDEMLELAVRNAAEAGVYERRVRAGHDRVRPAPLLVDRRRHQQLRHQPRRRQGRRLPRDRACPPAGWPGRRERRRRRRRPDARANGPSAAASSAASPGRSRSASSAPGSRPSG